MRKGTRFYCELRGVRYTRRSTITQIPTNRLADSDRPWYHLDLSCVCGTIMSSVRPSHFMTLYHLGEEFSEEIFVT